MEPTRALASPTSASSSCASGSAYTLEIPEPACGRRGAGPATTISGVRVRLRLHGRQGEIRQHHDGLCRLRPAENLRRVPSCRPIVFRDELFCASERPRHASSPDIDRSIPAASGTITPELRRKFAKDPETRSFVDTGGSRRCRRPDFAEWAQGRGPAAPRRAVPKEADPKGLGVCPWRAGPSLRSVRDEQCSGWPASASTCCAHGSRAADAWRQT